MRSPICNLEDSIAGVAFKIAPEKEKQCLADQLEYGISINLIDDVNFSIRVDLKNRGRITILANIDIQFI